MKILITESQFRNILDEYFNRIIKSPEYDFVDRIEVIEGTTKTLKWIDTHDTPFYDYIIYINDYDEQRIEELREKIGDIHMIVFPRNDDGTARAYYSINYEYEL
jgi:hypothetical protein